MRDIVEVSDTGELIISPYVLAIHEFGDLYKHAKKAAPKEMSAVWYFADMRSPYMRIDEDKRWAEIAQDVLTLDWTPSTYVLAAVEKYRELSRTPSMDTLESGWIAQRELNRFLSSIQLDDKDNGGKLIHNPKQIQEILKQMPLTIKSLQDTKRLVDTETAENLILRGGREKAEFEDDITNPG